MSQDLQSQPRPSKELESFSPQNKDLEPRQHADRNSDKNENKHHHHGHQHNFSSEKRLLISVFIILSFMIIEIIGGIMSNSLALLADAGHMASDFFALLIAWFSQKYAKKPADEKRSYGYQRIKIIAAFINSVALFVISIFIITEAVERFGGHGHHHVDWHIMLPVAISGAVANICIYLLLSSCKEQTLNIRSAVTHVIGDLLGSCVAIVGALIIRSTGWMFIDPILSLIVVAIIIKIAILIIKQASHILLEGTPQHIDNERITNTLLTKLKVQEIHHIHVWSLSEEMVIATLHMVVYKDTNIADFPDLLKKAKDSLLEIGITHATIEIEMEGSPCSDNRGL